MSFIDNNKNIIRKGLYAVYSNEKLKEENNRLYLSHQQIDGILEYLGDMAGDDDLIIEEFIDEVIINGYGFNEAGEPIEIEEA